MKYCYLVIYFSEADNNIKVLGYFKTREEAINATLEIINYKYKIIDLWAWIN